MDRPLTTHELHRLIEKQQAGTCTPEEEALLTRWFEQVPVIEGLTFGSEEEKENIRADIHSAVMASIQVPESKSRPFKNIWTVGMAAAILIGIALWMGFYITRPAMELVKVTTPQGVEKMRISLPDGSEVWLAAGSTLSYPREFEKNARKTTLSGTAYFSVKPDKNAPFSVEAPQGLSVSVLGTSFVIDSEKQAAVSVSVLTGKVQVKESGHAAIVVPGEKLQFSPTDKKFVKQPYVPGDLEKWTGKHPLVLTNVSLGDLEIVLHNMYHIGLQYDKAETARLRFNMSIPEGLPVDEVLNMLNNITGLKFTRSGDNVSVGG